MADRRKLLTAEQSPDLGDWAEPTVYHAQSNPVYRGNPLIEALPGPWPVNEVIDLLKRYPDFDASQRDLPVEDRLDMLENVAQVFQPLNEHLTLYQRLSRSLRGGYVGRNVFDIPTLAQTRRRLLACQPQKQGRALARGFYIIGMSGMGKTISTEAILDLYPQVIWHSAYQGQAILRAQVPWLKLECPYDGSTRALCFAFFASLDQLLGTNYYAAYAENGSASVTRMQIYMAFMCDLLNIGILVIDEIQHLNRAKSGGAEAMLNFFVSLSNVIRTPVVLIGTYHAFEIFTREFRQMRRGLRQGNIIWQRMQKDEPSWQSLLRGIWKYQYVRQPVPLSPELNAALYYVSQGVTELVIVAFMLAQERAISDGLETITPDLIYSAAADSMEIAYKPLQDLRTHSTDLQAYDDVVLPIELQDGYVGHRPAPAAGKTVLTAPSDPGPGNAGVTGPPHESAKTEAPQPHLVPSAADLRHSLQQAEATGESLYQALKAAGTIAQAADFVPQEGRPC